MRRLVTIILFLLSVLPGAAQAQKAAPSLEGIWDGVCQAVAVGQLGHAQDMSTPGFMDVSFTLTIDRQVGRRFYGTKSSAQDSETVLGILDPDGKTLSMVDSDGVYTGRVVSKNELFVRYMESSSISKVVSTCTYRRKR